MSSADPHAPIAVPPDKWHDQIGDPTVADAILDRLVHRAFTFQLKGASRRPRKGAKKSKSR